MLLNAHLSFFFSIIAFIAWLFLILTPAYASKCRAGASSQVLLSSSGLVALVRTRMSLQNYAINSRNRTPFVGAEVLKIFKPAVQGAVKVGGNLPMSFPGVDPKFLLGQRVFLVFAERLRNGVWEAGLCRLIEIVETRAKRACIVLADLYSENPYERERKCLLAYPPDAPLADVAKLLTNKIQDKREYRGEGRVSREVLWQSRERFQSAELRFDRNTARDFLGDKTIKGSMAVSVYLPVGRFNQQEMQRLLRLGRKVTFHGFWEKGSFVIAELK